MLKLPLDQTSKDIRNGITRTNPVRAGNQARGANIGDQRAGHEVNGQPHDRGSARSQGNSGVPPVGVEPTLGTLLGGRPLPLGYGGSEMIPRAVHIMHG